MAQHKSAKKRARQTLVRRARNRHVRSTVRTAIKAARDAITGGEADASSAAVRLAESSIRKAASKGVISKKQASRQVSRLYKRANASRA
ncbi:MAG TPA: 30S ribosomal protein S20 [Myxococcota bacterium]